MLKLVSVIIFVIFGLLGAHAVYQLGYWQVAPLIGVMISYLVWEILTSDVRETQYRQKLFANIAAYKNQPIPTVSNLYDAKQAIEILANNLRAVTDELVTLKSKEMTK